MKWVLLCLLLKLCSAYNVLLVFPEPTKSHGILGDGYVRLLLEAKHKVTYITPFPWRGHHENLTQIDISSNLNISGDAYDKLKDYTEQAMFLQMLSYVFGEMVVTHPAVKEFLLSKQNFDVVVAEWIDSELYASFAAYFKTPLIWSVSTHLHWQPLRLMDEVPNPAYSVDVNSGYIPPLSLLQRWHELWVQLRKSWIIHFKIKALEENLYNSVFEEAAKQSGVTVPPFAEVHKSYAMMLVNTHYSVASAWRVPPSVKEIGGYHIKLPPSRMDVDLETKMNSSTSGVIYFSFGTTVSDDEMSANMIDRLVRFFGLLNQTVVWKMTKRPENLPNNVYLMDWAPQTSILAHPNTKLFITHGGLLSTIETIHFGVPVIAVPHGADQGTNVDAMVKKGVAIKLEFNDQFPDELLKAMVYILNNSSYKENMKKVSQIYHDRPTPPSKELVHWIEHVVRTRSASHLRSPALDVPLYQKLYIELASVVIAILIVFITLLVIICCRIKKCCQR